MTDTDAVRRLHESGVHQFRLGAFVPNVCLGDLLDVGTLTRLPYELTPGAVESPFGDVDSETETRDERPSREILIVVVHTNLRACTLEELLGHPARNLGAIARIDVRKPEQLRPQH